MMRKKFRNYGKQVQAKHGGHADREEFQRPELILAEIPQHVLHDDETKDVGSDPHEDRVHFYAEQPKTFGASELKQQLRQQDASGGERKSRPHALTGPAEQD